MADQHSDLDQQKTARRRQSADSAAPSSADGPTHPVLRLQSQVGNAQVARLLAQREAPEDELRAKHAEVGTEGGPVAPDTSARIQAMRGSGSPLDPSTRSSMESAFDAPFGDVRVHGNNESDQLNRQLTARAFTTGSDIFLRSDANPSDTRLMAHELTHVVQQRSMGSSGGGMHVGPAGDEHERSADAAADTVTSAPVSQASVSPTAQREVATPDEEINAMHDVAQREAVPDEAESD